MRNVWSILSLYLKKEISNLPMSAEKRPGLIAMTEDLLQVY